MTKCCDEISAIYFNHSRTKLWDCFSLYTLCLKSNPPDISLLQKQNLDAYINLDFIPWQVINGITYVVATNKSSRLLAFLHYQYRDKFVLLKTSHRDICRFIQLKFSHFLLETAKNSLHKNSPEFSAYNLLTNKHKQTLWICTIIMTSAFILAPISSLLGLMVIANIIFLINSLFKMLLFFCATLPSKSQPLPQSYDLPIYTILLPVYKEDYAILALVRAIKRLDYPREKLDIKLIIEQLDRKTISFINRLGLDESFQIICVPHDSLKTKPKACNYALQFAKGKYVVIYDAEDRPDPSQLRKAAAILGSRKDIACVQTRLNYFNREEGVLPAFFAIEYSLLFDFFLRGLERLGIPIPLGGSSCHFKHSVLTQLGIWDPHNVTEDADIGFRLYLHGYKTSTLDSYTMEESPISLMEWLNQRTRWIKGHIQTCLVHGRNFKLAINKIGLAKTLGFYCFLFLPIIAYILQPLVFLVGNAYLFTDLLNQQYIMVWSFSCFNICLWLALSYSLAFFAISKHRWQNLCWQILFYPCYYFLHPFAALKALWQLFANPYYWHKTSHDYHRRHKRELDIKIKLKTSA